MVGMFRYVALVTYRLNASAQNGPRRTHSSLVPPVLMWRSPTIRVLLVPSGMVARVSGLRPVKPSVWKIPLPFLLYPAALFAVRGLSNASSQNPPQVFVLEGLPMPLMPLYE